MRPAAEVLRDGQWAGRPAYVIGGGPSLRGFDFERLQGLSTIGVNYALIHEPAIAYLGDDRLIRKLMALHQWRTERTVKVVHGIHEEEGFDYPEAYWLKIATSKVLWGRSLAEGVCGACNSGTIAVNLADILGADPIYLLGFDARPAEEPLPHYHDFYPSDWQAGGACQRIIEDFEMRARFIRGRVLNCSPNSALEVFPKITIEEALCAPSTS